MAVEAIDLAMRAARVCSLTTGRPAHVAQAQEFAKVLEPLFKQLAKCLNSSHFQVRLSWIAVTGLAWVLEWHQFSWGWTVIPWPLGWTLHHELPKQNKYRTHLRPLNHVAVIVCRFTCPILLCGSSNALS